MYVVCNFHTILMILYKLVKYVSGVNKIVFIYKNPVNLKCHKYVVFKHII